ncbi:MAG: PqqD family protein [bacterium]
MINSYVVRSMNTAFRIIDNNATILSPEEGILHSLNEVGTRIWELADGKMTIKEIIYIICNEYNVEEDVAKKEVCDFVKELCNKKLIVLEMI